MRGALAMVLIVGKLLILRFMVDNDGNNRLGSPAMLYDSVHVLKEKVLNDKHS